MGITVQIDSRKDFENVTEMIQPGILADIVDLGEQPNPFKPGTTQHKIRFVWIVAEEDSEGRQKRVFEKFTLSLNEKATLRKRLGEFGIKDFDKDKPFDVESVLGTARLLVLAEEDAKEPGKKPFVKVTATMPLKKGMTAPQIPADFVRAKDRPAKQ